MARAVDCERWRCPAYALGKPGSTHKPNLQKRTYRNQRTSPRVRSPGRSSPTRERLPLMPHSVLAQRATRMHLNADPNRIGSHPAHLPPALPCLRGLFHRQSLSHTHPYLCPLQNETDTMSQPTRLTVAGWKQCSFFVKAANVAASLEHLFPSRIKVRGRSRRPPFGASSCTCLLSRLPPFRARLPPRTSECLGHAR